jgi:hypothetical protein
MEVAARDEEMADGVARRASPHCWSRMPLGRSWRSCNVGAWSIIRRFSAALGLHALLASRPGRDVFSEEFLRQHHRYADRLYECWLDSVRFRAVRRTEFQFELYASGEYARLLEKEWGAQ